MFFAINTLILWKKQIPTGTKFEGAGDSIDPDTDIQLQREVFTRVIKTILESPEKIREMTRTDLFPAVPSFSTVLSLVICVITFTSWANKLKASNVVSSVPECGTLVNLLYVTIISSYATYYLVDIVFSILMTVEYEYYLSNFHELTLAFQNYSVIGWIFTAFLVYCVWLCFVYCMRIVWTCFQFNVLNKFFNSIA